MSVNSLPQTVTRQRRGCDLSPSAPESSTLTTRLPSQPRKHNTLETVKTPKNGLKTSMNCQCTSCILSLIPAMLHCLSILCDVENDVNIIKKLLRFMIIFIHREIQ